MNGMPKETTDSNFDVIIIGGGLAGASLACTLSGINKETSPPFKIAVVEAHVDCIALFVYYISISCKVVMFTRHRKFFNTSELQMSQYPTWFNILDKIT